MNSGRKQTPDDHLLRAVGAERASERDHETEEGADRGWSPSKTSPRNLYSMNELERTRELIKRAECIVALSGAGLSAESGVPTFRAAGDGLWAKYDPMKLASPDGFREDPSLVIDWYNWRRRAVATAEPNPAHRALAQRADIINVTQNVDDLLDRAGATNIIRLHGTLTHDRCHRRCGYRTAIDMNDPPSLRGCPDCPATLRPDVVWFGESLPADEWLRAEEACTRCDLLLVIGTSAVVYPAAGLISVAKSAGAKVIVVNKEPGSATGLADLECIGRAGELLPRLLAAGR